MSACETVRERANSASHLRVTFRAPLSGAIITRVIESRYLTPREIGDADLELICIHGLVADEWPCSFQSWPAGRNITCRNDVATIKELTPFDRDSNCHFLVIPHDFLSHLRG